MQKTFEVLEVLNEVFLQTFCFMTAGAGGPGTVYLEQSGLGVGSLLIDARGTDPLIKMTSQCREFDIQESGSISCKCGYFLQTGQVQRIKLFLLFI